ncbi:MAG: helix-turn-helix domain-containing protein [Thermomicrobium sp.]|nr:helix-turn-helix domain-containing protein [Thermomicrobium sp.]
MHGSRPARTLSTGERVLQALQLIVERYPHLSVKELAVELGVSLSTAYHLVQTLAATGYVAVERHRGLRPGPVLFRLLERLQAYPDSLAEYESLVAHLGATTGCRAYLATWAERDVEVLYIHGRRGVRELPGLTRGFRGAAHALALGKVLLAGRAIDEWPEYLRGEQFPVFTPNTIAGVATLQEELAAVRANGVAFDREEYALGSSCIAVPLAPGCDRAQVALGISVPVRRFQTEGHLLVALLRHMATASVRGGHAVE